MFWRHEGLFDFLFREAENESFIKNHYHIILIFGQFSILSVFSMALFETKWRLQTKPEKSYRASEGFEPVASALALQCST